MWPENRTVVVKALLAPDNRSFVETCPYCGAKTKLVHSSIIYGRGRDYGMAYICANYPKCDAYVTCHPGTDNPCGKLANRWLREARKKAHTAFDNIWRSKAMSRTEAYTKLAQALNIPLREAHIGQFDIPQCQQVVNWVEKGCY